jgi:hypothetical protein
MESGRRIFRRANLKRGSIFGLIIVLALLSFEFFNYGTTEFALRDLLGDLSFGILRWSTVLALAFCGMDFAGLARLMMPETRRHVGVDTWYLIGAWFLAATMNAVLTWWAVSLALISHNGLGNEVVGRQTLLTSVPVFVAMLVWLLRVLIIGTFTLNGKQLFSQDDSRTQLLLRPNTGHSSRPQAPRPGFARAAGMAAAPRDQAAGPSQGASMRR